MSKNPKKSRKIYKKGISAFKKYLGSELMEYGRANISINGDQILRFTWDNMEGFKVEEYQSLYEIKDD